MRLRLLSILVDDQDRALRFYTDVLGFVLRRDLPAGPARWITVVSPEGPDELELVLEPNGHPAGRAFQEAMFADGIPLAAFEVRDLDAEAARLERRGVLFTQKPTQMGPVKIAVFADTCGNLIQLYQPAQA